MRRHRDQIDASSIATLTSSVAGSPIASRARDCEARCVRARCATRVEIRAVVLASPPTRAASARRSAARPSRRPRARAAARRRSAAPALDVLEHRPVRRRVLDRDENVCTLDDPVRSPVHRSNRQNVCQSSQTLSAAIMDRHRPGERQHPARRDELAHLAPIAREHHQREHGERQLQAQDHLAQDRAARRCRARRRAPP